MSQSEIVVNQFLRFDVDRRLPEIEADVKSHGTQRRVVTYAGAYTVTEVLQRHIGYRLKHVPGIVKECPADVFNRRPVHRETVLKIADRFGIATAFGTRFVEVVTAKRGRTAGKIPDVDRCLFGHTIGSYPSGPK